MRHVVAACGIIALAGACPYSDWCDFPYGHVQTTSNTLKPGLKCCATLPPIPLMNSSGVLDGSEVTPDNGQCHRRVLDTGYSLVYPGLKMKDLPKVCQGDPPVCPDALYWRNLLSDSLAAQGLSFSKCEPLHPFYARYANAFSSSPYNGVPVLGSAATPVAAVASAQRMIREMVRQTTSQLKKHCPACQRFDQALSSKYARFTVWADEERSFAHCDECSARCQTSPGPEGASCCAQGTSRIFPGNKTLGKLNCTIDKEWMRTVEYKICYEGKDGSAMPNVPKCEEPGGADPNDATGASEELGVPYLLDDGTLYPGYQGRPIVIEEWFHTMHAMGIQTVDPEGYAMIHDNAVRLRKAGVWMSKTSKGHDYDRYDANEYEFMAMCVQTWLGIPEWTGYFAYQSRAEIKQKDPELARLINRFFEDSDWNVAAGFPIRSPRPQTNSCNRGFFGVNPNHKKGAIWRAGEPVVQAPDADCSDPCAAAPGSALCGEDTLGREYIGPPMSEV